MADGTIITSVTDALAICSNIIESANNEVVYLSPPLLVSSCLRIQPTRENQNAYTESWERAGHC